MITYNNYSEYINDKWFNKLPEVWKGIFIEYCEDTYNMKEFYDKIFQLKTISVSNENIETLEPLKYLLNLEILYCEETLIKSLDFLEYCINLKELHCRKNNLKSLKGIEGCKNLRFLNCSNNNLTSLDELKGLIKLEELYCNNNNLTSLRGIENCLNLISLGCNTNKISSIKEIRRLLKLEKLNIKNNKTMISIADLLYFYELNTLIISYHTMTNLSSLIALMNLKILTINRIEQNTNDRKLKQLIYLSKINKFIIN